MKPDEDPANGAAPEEQANGNGNPEVFDEEQEPVKARLKRNGKPMNEVDLVVANVIEERRRKVRAARAAAAELKLAQVHYPL